MHYKKLTMAKQCTTTTYAGHFDGHGKAPVRWGAHFPMEQVHGYTRYHWLVPLGKNLPRIAPADAMVIDFGSKKSNIGIVKPLFWS